MHADEPHGPARPVRGDLFVGPPAGRNFAVRPQGSPEPWTPAEYGYLCYRLGRIEALLDVMLADSRALLERISR